MDEGHMIVSFCSRSESRSFIEEDAHGRPGGAVIPGTGVDERKITMNFRGHRAEQPLSTFAEGDPDRPANESGISRRALFRYGSGTVVVAGVGLAGLAELLEHREAIAGGTGGTTFQLLGITHEPDEPEETPHRHTFSVRFR